jgi:hypothetical protein
MLYREYYGRYYWLLSLSGNACSEMKRAGEIIPYLTHYLTQIASKEKGARRFLI